MQKAPGCRIAVGRFIFGFQLADVRDFYCKLSY